MASLPPYESVAHSIDSRHGQTNSPKGCEAACSANMNNSPIRDSTEERVGPSGDKADRKCYDSDAVLSVDEYRKILNDNASTEKQIKQRVQYLEAFCRNIIRLELEKHAE